MVSFRGSGRIGEGVNPGEGVDGITEEGRIQEVSEWERRES